MAVGFGLRLRVRRRQEGAAIFGAALWFASQLMSYFESGPQFTLVQINWTDSIPARVRMTALQRASRTSSSPRSRRIPKMMCRSCIPLYGLLLSGTPGASLRRDPDTAIYCNTYADEVGCRERTSGGLHCRDLSKCNDLSNCSDADAARRVGMTCAGFPWWNGGWPLSPLHWDDEREFYECDTTASPSSTSDYCSQWMTVEDSEHEWEVGVCKCTQERNDNELGRPYCANWSCEQVEVSKCRSKMVQEGPDDGDGAWLRERFPGFRPSRRGDWDKYPYVCMCYSDHRGRYECGPEVETEKTDCSCLEVANQGVCKRW